MTPDQVDQLDDITYQTFVRYMVNEAREIQKAAKRGGR
jgi:hypothetical protein